MKQKYKKLVKDWTIAISGAVATAAILTYGTIILCNHYGPPAIRTKQKDAVECVYDHHERLRDRAVAAKEISIKSKKDDIEYLTFLRDKYASEGNNDAARNYGAIKNYFKGEIDSVENTYNRVISAIDSIVSQHDRRDIDSITADYGKIFYNEDGPTFNYY